jgi:hydroxylaminobenzene mutase
MGTAAANPILSQGHHGRPWQERIANAGFRSIAYSILIAVVLILWGLGRRGSVPVTALSAQDDVGLVMVGKSASAGQQS